MTLFHAEGTLFPSPESPLSPISSSCSCAEQVIPASSVPDTLWVPLDEAVYTWTTFGAMTMHNTALIATGSALHAISWEQTALRHYTSAQQGLRFLRTASASPTVLSLFAFTTDALSRATEQWRRVILWLERLANAHDDPPDAEVLDTIRDLYRQATDFQHRLWLLAGEVREEHAAGTSHDGERFTGTFHHAYGRRDALMPLFRRRNASYKEQRAVLPASLYGPEQAPAPPTSPPFAGGEEASQHNAGHSSGWHPEDAPYLTPGALQQSPVASHASVQPPQTTLRLPAAEREVPMQGDDPPTEMGMTRSPHRRREVPPLPPTSPRLRVVTPSVYTLGYSQPGARLVLDTLIWHEGWLLVDIRHAPVSTWPDWTQRALLQRYGPAYVHMPTLGNLHYRDHRLPIVLADAPTGVRSVVRTVYDGRRCLLLCACKDYRTCHREIVARLLQQAGVPVTHLVNQTLPAEQVRIGRTEDGVAPSLVLNNDQLQTAATQSLLTLTRTQTITLPVAGRLQSLSVQVALTAWPATRLAPRQAFSSFPKKGDPS